MDLSLFDALSPAQRRSLVETVAENLRSQLANGQLTEVTPEAIAVQLRRANAELSGNATSGQRQIVPPADHVRGTWQNKGDLRNLGSLGVDRIGVSSASGGLSAPEMARLIDHTLLKPMSTRADVIRVCKEAKEYGFKSVCLNTTWIRIAAQELRGSQVMPIAVVGFPLGAMSTKGKSLETRQAISDGAEEIDMVINIGALKGGDHNLVFDDIRAVVDAAQGRPVKVILETTMLSRAEKIAGCTISKAARAHFVKTSTGFGGGGATIEDVELMRSVVGPEMGVKASGGVRNADDLQKMVDAGATRIGASAGIAIVQGQTSSGSY